MSDKELIKQEIERIIAIEEETSHLDKLSFNSGRWKALTQVKVFIDSLPEESGCEANFTAKSEDLDYLVISLEETIGTSPHSREVIKEHLQKAAEWQRKQDQETIELAEGHAMLAGMMKEREEMMKDAVNGEYWIGEIHLDTPIIQGYNDGDTIKVIPIKEE